MPLPLRGLWKIRPFEKFSTKHTEPFSAEPFLTQAKGPMAGFFYAMVPDIDGRQRLRIETDANGKKSIDASGITARWESNPAGVRRSLPTEPSRPMMTRRPMKLEQRDEGDV